MSAVDAPRSVVDAAPDECEADGPHLAIHGQRAASDAAPLIARAWLDSMPAVAEAAVDDDLDVFVPAKFLGEIGM